MIFVKLFSFDKNLRKIVGISHCCLLLLFIIATKRLKYPTPEIIQTNPPPVFSTPHEHCTTFLQNQFEELEYN